MRVKIRERYIDGREAAGITIKPELVAPVTYVYWCSCPGCWACDGREPLCTCDVDWDALYERSR